MSESIPDQLRAELETERQADLRGISFSQAAAETGYVIEATAEQVTADAISARNADNTYYDQQFGLTQNWQRLPEQQQSSNDQGLDEVYRTMGWVRPSKAAGLRPLPQETEAPHDASEKEPRRSAYYIPTILRAKLNPEIPVRPIDVQRADHRALDKALRFPVGVHQVDRIPLNAQEYKGIIRSEDAYLADATATATATHLNSSQLRREETRLTTQIHYLDSKIISQTKITTGLEKEVADLSELVALLPRPEYAVMPHGKMGDLVDRFVFQSVANMIDVIGDDHNISEEERARAMEAVVRSLKTGPQAQRTEAAFGLLDLAHRYAIARKGLFESRTVQAERTKQTRINQLDDFLRKHGISR